jgi:hypothetical protein
MSLIGEQFERRKKLESCGVKAPTAPPAVTIATPGRPIL